MTTSRIFRSLIIPVMLCVCPLLTSCGDDDEPDPMPEPEVPELNLTFAGNTVTYPTANPSSTYTSAVGTYRFEVDESNSTARLYIENANFLENMPQLGVMEFGGISFAMTANGNERVATFACDALTPEIAGRPYPAFPITDLEATMRPGKSLELNFICTFRNTPFQVTFTGTPEE